MERWRSPLAKGNASRVFPGFQLERSGFGVRIFSVAMTICFVAGLAANRATADPWGSLVSEVKGGILEQDVPLISTVRHEKGVAIDGEIRLVALPLQSPVPYTNWLLTPRPTLGASAGLGPHMTDLLYGGMTWTIDLYGPIYADLFGGLSVHDGNARFDYRTWNSKPANPPVDPSDYQKFLGCRFLFREGVELGWRFGPGQEYSVSLLASHLSHGEEVVRLCNDTRNSGMDSVGLRFGYRFE